MTKIKFCGLRRREDIEVVNALKPDFAGFIVEVPGRRRSVTAAQLRELTELLEPGIIPVGVFLNAPLALPAALLREGVIAVAQLHGQEDERYIQELRKQAQMRQEEMCQAEMRQAETCEAEMRQEEMCQAEMRQAETCQAEMRQAEMRQAEMRQAEMCQEEMQHGAKAIIKAFSIRSAEDVQTAIASSADYILLDQGSGGTGRCFDWSLVPPIFRPWFLAGGLTPENLPQAIQRLRPWAVDLSSSLETDGIKDLSKMRAAMEALRVCHDSEKR